MSLLQITDLSKCYKEKKALNQVSLSVEEGEIVALIGKNGAGKTTLMNLIASIISPSGGEIKYKDIDLLKNPSYLSEFGILITAEFLDYLNTYENLKNLMLASGIKKKKQIDNTIEEVLGLVGLAAQKEKRVKTFSFGMKQRLGFAQTLLSPNRFLILDEPFVGMDPLGKEMMKNVILKKAREEGVGILFSSHDLTDVEEICDRIVMISSGEKIYDGPFTQEQQYEIMISGNVIKDNLFQLIPNTKDIQIFSDKVILKNKADLDLVMRAFVQNKITIKDLNVIGSSLYDFFDKEVV